MCAVQYGDKSQMHLLILYNFCLFTYGPSVSVCSRLHFLSVCLCHIAK